MNLNPAENYDRSKTRMELESDKLTAHPGKNSFALGWAGMRTVGAVLTNLLKSTGFYERARRNCFDYRLERNDVYLPDLPPSFDGYTILHMSDLHADGLVDRGEGLIRILKTVPCDLAVLTGDFSLDEAGVHYESCLEALAPIVSSLSVQDAVYGVLGNHDILEMVPGLELMGVQMLMNDAVQLQRGTAKIVLAGVDDPHFYECHDLHKALLMADSDQIVILLSHSPEIAAEAASCGVDFYLCGHTHGGQICLPGGIPMFANTSCNRGYLSGSWMCGSMQGYTNRGTGFSLAAARFFCPPEITLHTLHTGSMPCELYDTTEESFGAKFRLPGHAVFA